MRRTRISMLCAALLAAMPASAEAGGLGSVVGAIASVPQTLLGGLPSGGRPPTPPPATHTQSTRQTGPPNQGSRRLPGRAPRGGAPPPRLSPPPPPPGGGRPSRPPPPAPAGAPSPVGAPPPEPKPAESKPAE